MFNSTQSFHVTTHPPLLVPVIQGGSQWSVTPDTLLVLNASLSQVSMVWIYSDIVWLLLVKDIWWLYRIFVYTLERHTLLKYKQ